MISLNLLFAGNLTNLGNISITSDVHFTFLAINIFTSEMVINKNRLLVNVELVNCKWQIINYDF